MRRLLPVLAVMTLAVAACGGGNSSSSSSAAPAQSATALLASVKPPSGPQKVTADATLAFDGVPAAAASAAPLLQQPIDIKLSGVSDSTSGASDLDVTLALGVLDVKAKLLSDGTHTWLQYGNEWYDLGAGLDTAQLRQVIADPSKVISNPKIAGSGDAGGVPSTQVSGSLQTAGLAGLLAQVATATAGAGTTSTTTPAPQVLTSGDVSVWIGDADHQVHRATLHVVADTSQVQATQPMKGVTVDLDSTGAPTDPVTITPPANPKPVSELQQAILGAFGQGLTGSLGTTTG